jgi:SAM-dependent methyltransferase
MPTDHVQKGQEIYLLGGNANLEIARLTILERLKFETMGGLFVELKDDFSRCTRVLDLMSRLATWGISVAQTHSDLEVACIDYPGVLMDHAQAQAQVLGLENINFFDLTEDITRLDFPDGYFDLLNASHLFSFVLPHQWSAFLKECLRITHPGGYVRFIESEWGMTNSPAVEQLASLFLHGLKKKGQGLSPDGRNIGVVAMLGYLLKQAGWQDVKRQAFVTDYLTGPAEPSDPAAKVQVMANVMLKSILEQQMATQEEVDMLLAQAAVEVGQEDFQGLVLSVSFCAQKPLVASVF